MIKLRYGSTAKDRWINAKDTIKTRLGNEMKILRNTFTDDKWVDEFVLDGKKKFCRENSLNPGDFKYVLVDLDFDLNVWDLFLSHASSRRYIFC